MKRIILTIALLALMVMTCTPAFAGIFGTVKDFVAAEAWSLVIGAIIGALGMFGVSYRLWGKAVKELGEFVWSIYRAVLPASDGGKQITPKEMEKIIKEGTDIYPAVGAAIVSHKK